MKCEIKKYEIKKYKKKTINLMVGGAYVIQRGFIPEGRLIYSKYQAVQFFYMSQQRLDMFSNAIQVFCMYIAYNDSS